jgi:hypothetical protein
MVAVAARLTARAHRRRSCGGLPALSERDASVAEHEVEAGKGQYTDGRQVVGSGQGTGCGQQPDGPEREDRPARAVPSWGVARMATPKATRPRGTITRPVKRSALNIASMPCQTDE